jgi:elongation factor P--beta-lysine ligase
MLEWYRRSSDELDLMDECQALLLHLAAQPYARALLAEAQSPLQRSVADIFQELIRYRISSDDRVAGFGSRPST